LTLTQIGGRTNTALHEAFAARVSTPWRVRRGRALRRRGRTRAAGDFARQSPAGLAPYRGAGAAPARGAARFS